MTDNELLLAISNMLDPIRNDVNNIKDDLQGVKDDVNNIKGELQDVKDDVNDIKDDLQGVKDDVNNIKDDLQGVKDDVKGIKGELQDVKDDVNDIKVRVKRIELTQENIILPRLNTIESCYTSTFDRYKNNVETYESMKQDLSVLKTAVAEHSEQLQKIS